MKVLIKQEKEIKSEFQQLCESLAKINSTNKVSLALKLREVKNEQTNN